MARNNFQDKIIFKKNGFQVVKHFDLYLNIVYFLQDKNGNYIRVINSIYDVKNMPELFPALNNRKEA